MGASERRQRLCQRQHPRPFVQPTAPITRSHHKQLIEIQILQRLAHRGAQPWRAGPFDLHSDGPAGSVAPGTRTPS